MTGHIHRAAEESAGIVPEVENESVHPLLLEFVEGCGEFGGGGFVELSDADIADTGG